jgi:hypothetical protein
MDDYDKGSRNALSFILSIVRAFCTRGFCGDDSCDTCLIFRESTLRPGQPIIEVRTQPRVAFNVNEFIIRKSISRGRRAG